MRPFAIAAFALAALATPAAAVTVSNVTWSTTPTAIVLDATTDQPSGFGVCGGWGIKLDVVPDGATFAFIVNADASASSISRTDQEGIVGQPTVTAQDRALHVELPP